MGLVNAELEAIRDAMNPESGEGRDRDTARALAVAYIAAHPEEFAFLQNMGIESLCATVDVFRGNADEGSQWRVEAWLLNLFEQPQQVGGALQPGSPLTNG